MKNWHLLIFLAFIGLWAQPAMAYIDPGSGSIIMSAIIGFFVAINMAVKGYWYKLKALFSGSKKERFEHDQQDHIDNKE